MAQFQNARQQMSNCLFHHCLSLFQSGCQTYPSFQFFKHLVNGSIN